MAFRGHFEHSLDAKNRLSIPARFRTSFAGGTVLAKDPEPCVAVWTPETHEGILERALGGLNPMGSEYRKLSRFYQGNSFEIELDGLRCLVLVEATGLPEGTLSPREDEIARMVGLGYPNKTIAANLGISSWTVSTHLRRMFAKFGVSSRAALVASEIEERRVFDERRALRR